MPEAADQQQQNQNQNQNQNGGGGGGAGDDTVSKSAYDATKADLHKYKEEARILREEKEKRANDELKSQEKWKEFGAAKEQEATQWKQKYETLANSQLDRAKIEAVKAQCKALGLIDAAMEDLEAMEFKDVVVETTSTGRINVIGAKGAAERMKSLKPHWFGTTQTPPVNTKVPKVTDGTGGDGSSDEYAELDKLEKEAAKTGDYTKYKEALMKLKTKK